MPPMDVVISNSSLCWPRIQSPHPGVTTRMKLSPGAGSPEKRSCKWFWPTESSTIFPSRLFCSPCCKTRLRSTVLHLGRQSVEDTRKWPTDYLALCSMVLNQEGSLNQTSLRKMSEHNR